MGFTPKGIALIGICYAQLENFESALEYISIAIEQSNIFIKSWHESSLFHYKLGEFDNALKTSKISLHFILEKKIS